MLRTSDHESSAENYQSSLYSPVETASGLRQLVDEQGRFFRSGATRPHAFRIEQLKRLYRAIHQREASLLDALKKDLRKHRSEAYMAEIGFVYCEITEAIKKLSRWMAPKRVPSPLVIWPATSRLVSEPLGRCLIISAWNYPVQLSIAPIVGAIAAGNVMVLKPSELASHTARILVDLINTEFPHEYLHAVEGGADVASKLLDLRWDHIFFTGSTSVGKIVAGAAAKHLTPCTLELGGKSPCLVTRHANLKLAARRVVFGKFLNVGQTCVAPDYVLVEHSVHDAFIRALSAEILSRFGANPLQNDQLGKIVNERHFHRLAGLLDPAKVCHGGRCDSTKLMIEPTLMKGVTLSDPIMHDEIFGPILPILSVQDLSEAKAIVQAFEKPLALYLFSADRSEQDDVISSLSFGGGCINDTLIHTANPHLPFGGVGQSGSGAYHGHHSFNTFSHQKSIVLQKNAVDLPIRYNPWNSTKERLIRFLVK